MWFPSRRIEHRPALCNEGPAPERAPATKARWSPRNQGRAMRRLLGRDGELADEDGMGGGRIGAEC